MVNFVSSHLWAIRPKKKRKQQFRTSINRFSSHLESLLNSVLKSVILDVDQYGKMVSHYLNQHLSYEGDENKPKSWSKYAPDSSAYQKAHGIVKEPKEDAKKSKKQKSVNPILQQLAEKVIIFPS